jgi:hypothetical protein
VLIVTSESRDRPTKTERSKKVFYGDYSYELAKERMETAIRDREHDGLVKQLRLARKGPRSGLVARSAAFLTTLFR